MSKPTEEQIRKRAQEIWEENHRPTGRDDEFWFQAEKELNEGLAHEPLDTLPGGIPCFSGVSDGPYSPKALRRKLLGRLVGYSETALGGLLDACAEPA
jgi:Protein of unknown function (DUF2934)